MIAELPQERNVRLVGNKGPRVTRTESGPYEQGGRYVVRQPEDLLNEYRASLRNVPWPGVTTRSGNWLSPPS